MSQEGPEEHIIKLDNPAISQLISATNKQFEFWGETLEKLSNPPTKDSLSRTHALHMWFVLTYLAIRNLNLNNKIVKFSANKNEVHEKSIPGVGIEMSRKMAAELENRGFVITMGKNNSYLRLEESGIEALERTLGAWVKNFADVQKALFSSQAGS